MGFWLLMLAVALSLFGAFFHGVIGARIYMHNINNSNLANRGKTLSLVSWYMFTILLLVSAATFAAVAFNLMTAMAAYPLIAINTLGALMFISFALTGHKVLLRLPGAYLMGSTAASGYLGVAWLG